MIDPAAAEWRLGSSRWRRQAGCGESETDDEEEDCAGCYASGGSSSSSPEENAAYKMMRRHQDGGRQQPSIETGCWRLQHTEEANNKWHQILLIKRNPLDVYKGGELKRQRGNNQPTKDWGKRCHWSLCHELSDLPRTPNCTWTGLAIFRSEITNIQHFLIPLTTFWTTYRDNPIVCG